MNRPFAVDAVVERKSRDGVVVGYMKEEGQSRVVIRWKDSDVVEFWPPELLKVKDAKEEK